MAPPQSANVSRRAWICYLPHPLPFGTPTPYTPHLPEHNPLDIDTPSEPTSTIVLTSPSACFVDIRILKKVDLAGEKLEWAFAGWSESEDISIDKDNEDEDDVRSASTLVQPPSKAKPKPLGLTTHNHKEQENTNKPRFDPQLFGISNHIFQHNKDNDNASQATTAVASPKSQSPNCKTPTLRPTKRMTWHHHIDSRYPIGSSIPTDTGLIYPLNETQTIEIGCAVSFPGFPKGSCTNYEELWEDLDIHATRHDDGSNKKVCVVLRTQDVSPDQDPARGIVIRLGQFVQGILRKGESVTVERWELLKTESDADATWKRTFKLGPEGLPCAAAQREEDLELGMKIDMLGYEWEVAELIEWV